ncbi:hypothetical protein RAA17_12885 [Komagataeibacter rhaeticus]|nr:hypothetical protein [Komagataeibacter rhaeticus]
MIAFLFDELDILDIRLRELNDIVDYFVICESSLTFNGDPKPKLFLENAGRYKRYQDRIIHFSVDFFPPVPITGAAIPTRRSRSGKPLPMSGPMT